MGLKVARVRGGSGVTPASTSPPASAPAAVASPPLPDAAASSVSSRALSLPSAPVAPSSIPLVVVAALPLPWFWVFGSGIKIQG